MSTSTRNIKATAKVTISKTGAKYSPSAASAQNNKDSWDTLKNALKQPQTLGSLQATLKAQHNHAPFVGYCIRRGWLVAK